MKKWNMKLAILAGAVVIIGIVIYGGMSLYSKLNQVNELNERLDESAEAPAGLESPNPTKLPSDPIEQTPAAEPTPTPELVPSTQPEDVIQPITTATSAPKPTSDNVDKGQKPEKEAASSEEKSRKKKEIDASVTAKLGKLQSSCQSVSSSLVQQIAEELNGNKDATLADIQSKYLSKVVTAESDCDLKFNELISSAKSEYKAAELGDQPFPDWSSQYESAKAGARADALAVIVNSIK